MHILFTAYLRHGASSTFVYVFIGFRGQLSVAITSDAVVNWCDVQAY